VSVWFSKESLECIYPLIVALLDLRYKAKALDVML
jgi:hypothetical protein